MKPIFLLILLFISSNTSFYGSCLPIKTSPLAYIKRSCDKTLYPNLCFGTLSKYATKIGTSPKLLASTALQVTFNNTRSVRATLQKLSRTRGLRPGETAELIECVDVVSDSVYQLQRSINRLDYSTKGPEFVNQMSDVQTWASAALTDDDTCMDDFTTTGKMRSLVRGLIVRVASFTSISLAFINDYAAAV